MRPRSIRPLILLLSPLLTLVGCDQGPPGSVEPTRPGKSDRDGPTVIITVADDPGEGELELAGDVRRTDLRIDLAQQLGTATLEIDAADADPAIALEAGGLTIHRVTDETGTAIDYRLDDDGRLVIAQHASGSRLVIEYAFAEQQSFDGWLAGGMTFTWPYYCGNLFPCDPSPSDGLRLSLEIVGVPDQRTAIFPTAIDSDAPAYMLAWAVGDYRYLPLGSTEAGTELGVWYLPGQQQDPVTGSAELLATFDWLERTLGPYAFGPRAGSVAVPWGPGAYGGMEHHPFWHIGEASFADPVTHVHEAVHGWFGNGVRIRCWEDFVLSEGTTSYLAARALEAVGGADRGTEVWQDYRDQLERAVAAGDAVAWPDSCGTLDILDDGLFSAIPYMKGAFFFKAVADAVGADALDAVFAGFYRAHLGTARGMKDLLDAVAAETGFDPEPLATAWLRGPGIPD